MKTRKTKRKPKRKAKSKNLFGLTDKTSPNYVPDLFKKDASKHKLTRKAYLKAKRTLDKDRSDRNYLSNPDMTTSTVSWGIYEDVANSIKPKLEDNAFKDNLTYMGILSLALLTLIVITSKLYSLLFG